MARVGVLGRVVLILMVALVAVAGAAIALDRLAGEYRGRPMRAPRAVHAAGLIALMRAAEPRVRRAVLASGSNAQLRLAIVEGEPAPTRDDIPAPHLLKVLDRFFVTPIPGLRVFTNATMGHVEVEPPFNTEGRITKVFAPLGDGRTLMIQWVDAPRIVRITLLGLPPSAWAGVLGFAVAVLALATLVREMRPLRRLTQSVITFEGEAPREAPPVAGAPDVQKLVLAVHEMQERVAALLAERSFLIGAISHDLRTYLTRMRLRVEEVEDAKTRERMVGDLDAMTALIDTSLAFARGTTSSDHRRVIDLGDLVAVEVEEHRALGAPPTFSGRYADDATMLGDPVALRRVFGNIFDNARRFARDTVAVRLEVDRDHLRVTIEDDGPGIPEADREAVFDPFFRLERSRSRHTGGTGLGLAIARQIVEAHGGTIEVAGDRARGATFLLSFPAARFNSTNEARREAGLANASGSQSAGGDQLRVE